MQSRGRVDFLTAWGLGQSHSRGMGAVRVARKISAITPQVWQTTSMRSGLRFMSVAPSRVYRPLQTSHESSARGGVTTSRPFGTHRHGHLCHHMTRFCGGL